MTLEVYSDMILDMAKQGLSSAEISARISHVSGGARGCSARNVRRFCAENDLSLMGLPDAYLELEVAKAITEVCTCCVCVRVKKRVFYARLSQLANKLQ